VPKGRQPIRIFWTSWQIYPKKSDLLHLLARQIGYNNITNKFIDTRIALPDKN
jgi:hypothetical protein